MNNLLKSFSLALVLVLGFSVSIQAQQNFGISTAVTIPSCDMSDGSIQVTWVNGDPPVVVRYDDGFIGSIRNNIESGRYTINVRDNGGRDTTFVMDLFGPGNTVIDTTIVTGAVLCNGDMTGSAEIRMVDQTQNYTYLWDDPLASTGPTIAGLGARTYRVRVSNATNTCTKFDSVVITEPAALMMDTTLVNNSCFGASDGSIDVTITGGTPVYRYDWVGPNGFTSNLEDISNLVAGIYTLEVNDGNSCTEIYTYEITGPATGLQVSILQSDTSCFGLNQSSIVAAVMGGSMPFQFSWMNGPQNPIWLSAPDGWQYITVIDANNCRVTDSIEVVSYDSLSAQINVTPPSCQGNDDGVVAVVSVTGGSGNGMLGNYTYSWDYNNIDSIAITSAVGDRDYTVTIADLNGCEGMFTRFLPDGDSIDITLDFNDLFCSGDSSGFIEVTSVTSLTPPLNYLWNTGATTPRIDNLSSGTYSVVVSDGSGCEAMASHVFMTSDSIIINASPNNPICSELYGDVEIIMFGGLPPFTVDWIDGDTSIIRDSLLRGSYPITVTDANGCMETTTVFVQTESEFSDYAILVDSVTCFNSRDGGIELSPSDGSGPYEYSINGGQSFGPFQNFYELSPGRYDIVIRDADGCELMDSVTINNPDPIRITNIRDTSMLFGDTLYILPEITGNQGNYDVDWPWDSLSPGYYVLDTISGEAIFYPVQNSSYSLTVVDEMGCETDIFFTLDVDKDPTIFVPTAFTPDQNFNNLLGLLGEEDVFVEEFRIFDRWGELMYENTEFFIDNSPQGWDGDFNGDPSPPGVYAWYAVYIYSDKIRYVAKGHTTLLR